MALYLGDGSREKNPSCGSWGLEYRVGEGEVTHNRFWSSEQQDIWIKCARISNGHSLGNIST